MPSSSDAKESPKAAGEISIAKLSNGDKQWEERMMRLSRNPDKPPIFPDWNVLPCEEFFNKAVDYGASGGTICPPVQLFDGSHPGGPATPDRLQELQLGILNYVASMTPGVTVIGGANSSVGLACNAVQGLMALSQLGRLELNDWFAAVLNHGAPLTGTLATLYTPRPRVVSGLCDMVHYGCILFT